MKKFLFVFVVSSFFLLGCNETVKLTHKGEREIKKINGEWEMTKKELISFSDGKEVLLPETLILKIEPCSFNNDNNTCELKFIIDRFNEKNTLYVLSITGEKKTALRLEIPSVSIGNLYSDKEKMFNSSSLFLDEISNNLLKIRVANSFGIYNLELKRNNK
jgi:hypothetical protein